MKILVQPAYMSSPSEVDILDPHKNHNVPAGALPLVFALKGGYTIGIHVKSQVNKGNMMFLNPDDDLPQAYPDVIKMSEVEEMEGLHARLAEAQRDNPNGTVAIYEITYVARLIDQKESSNLKEDAVLKSIRRKLTDEEYAAFEQHVRSKKT